MNELPQMANAMLALVFAAVMLVAGQLYIKSRSAKAFLFPEAQAQALTVRKSNDESRKLAAFNARQSQLSNSHSHFVQHTRP